MPAEQSWFEAPIARSHDRAGFDCGVRELNDYLRRYARQNHESGSAKTYVAVPRVDPRRVLGYYSVAPLAVAYARTPLALRKGLGQYEVPGFRLARLAVATSAQHQGLGAWLLASAAERCLRVADSVGGVFLVIDAKDDRAAQWYARFGAVPLLDTALTLVMPFARVRAAMAASARYP
jgi:GNAT superfamily N-acetyltransferase